MNTRKENITYLPAFYRLYIYQLGTVEIIRTPIILLLMTCLLHKISTRYTKLYIYTW